LIAAALNTDNIEAKPEPFVLQKSLDDYSVNYQLNATTKDAVSMPRTHSNMNANILDVFNEAGLEIMSPMFVATRDGAEATIPAPEQLANSADSTRHPVSRNFVTPGELRLQAK